MTDRDNVFVTAQTWFEQRYGKSVAQAKTQFNHWLELFRQSTTAALQQMDDKGKQVWREMKAKRICVVLRDDLPGAERHPLKKDPNVFVEGDSTGRIKRVCYPAHYGREYVESKVPDIMKKDEEGCKLCRRVGANPDPEPAEATYDVIDVHGVEGKSKRYKMTFKRLRTWLKYLNMTAPHKLISINGQTKPAGRWMADIGSAKT